MPYLTHADAEVAKAAEAEAAARSKIAITAPVHKPVIAATAPARNGEAEFGSTCALKRSARRRRRSQRGDQPLHLRQVVQVPLARVVAPPLVAQGRGWFVPEQNPSFVLAEVPVPPGKAPKKGANKVGKEKSDKAPGPKQLKVWAEKHDVVLVQYVLAAGYPRLSVTGRKGK
ncbi:hypothetical protein T492DRAFT_1103053, partial [Pavlovales sp. CCMP2436]